MKFKGNRLFIIILSLFVCLSGLVYTATDSAGNLCAPNVCTDCHRFSLCGSQELVYLRQIDWDTEKHGLNSGDVAVVLYIHANTPPELSPRLVLGGALYCTDCHEYHDASTPNAYLLKNNVNNIAVEVPIPRFDYDLCSFSSVTGNKAMGWFCRTCHKDDAHNPMTPTAFNMWQQAHHYLRGGADYPYNRTRCYNCHTTSAGGTPINCECCHFHGSMTTDYGTSYPCYLDSYICRTPYDRRTF
ncbi:MAG: hypothetical protein AB1442_05855 [Nitrospirota bacterium]